MAELQSLIGALRTGSAWAWYVSIGLGVLAALLTTIYWAHFVGDQIIRLIRAIRHVL